MKPVRKNLALAAVVVVVDVADLVVAGAGAVGLESAIAGNSNDTMSLEGVAIAR